MAGSGRSRSVPGPIPASGADAARVRQRPVPWIANVDPFLVESTSQFRTDGPNALTSAEYTAEYNEVKELGSLTSTSRTPEQTAVAGSTSRTRS